jgi:hypothetical protein
VIKPQSVKLYVAEDLMNGDCAVNLSETIYTIPTLISYRNL